jgi:hypothetical protein
MFNRNRLLDAYSIKSSRTVGVQGKVSVPPVPSVSGKVMFIDTYAVDRLIALEIKKEEGCVALKDESGQFKQLCKTKNGRYTLESL